MGNKCYEKVVLGISSQMDADMPEDEIEQGWYARVDTLYFSHAPILVILSSRDEEIIAHSLSCYQKLKALQYQPHITLKRWFDASL